jgi:microsomal dipeptidase-like Zn-dependent dipeptidase
VDALNFSRFDRERLVELRDAGITCTHVTCAVWEGPLEAIRNIRRWEHLLEENADVALQVTSGEDIRRAKREGKVGIILGFQNSSPLNGELELVSVFRRLGVPIMQLTYNNQSLIASGCYEDEDAGIPRFGREVIREMNRVGMLIDLSHVGDRSSYEAIELSERPVAITHSNPKWFNDVGRNKSDRVLRALGERGGVVGVSTFTMLMPGGSPAMMTSAVSVDDFCEMVARLADQIGVEHVGIGTDAGSGQPVEYILWCRMGTWTRTSPPTQYGDKPEWLAGGPAGQVPRIYEGLRRQQFSPSELEAIMGGNWLRLFDESFLPRP